MVSRQDWINAALDQLLHEGAMNVKVERLARRLKVTKGSFYWHFDDREDLLRQAAANWQDTQLAFLHSLESKDHPTPEDRLRALFTFIADKDARADIAVRLWARRTPWVDTLVEKVDQLRLNYCESIFNEMGFSRDDARLRAHLVYYYQVAEQTLSYREPDESRQALDQLRFELLTSRS